MAAPVKAPPQAAPGLAYISSPAETAALAKKGYHIVDYQGAQFYDPNQGGVGNQMEHIPTPAWAQAIAKSGFKVAGAKGGEYYQQYDYQPNPYSSNPAGFSQVQQLLAQYGLSDLSSWALKEMQKGANADQVEIDMRSQKPWIDRFGGSILARQKAGLPPISETDVVNFEDTAHQLAQKYGLPAGFMDRSVTDEWLAQDMSTSEMDERLNNVYNKVASAPPEVLNYFDQQFGVGKGTGALAAYILDANKAEPLLLQQASAANMGGEATRYGINLSGQDAMTLAQAGVTQDRAMTGFQDVDKLSALFQNTVGDTMHLDKGQGVEADILGNAQMLDTEQQKLSARAATAKGKVGVEENPEKGFEGLGAGF